MFGENPKNQTISKSYLFARVGRKNVLLPRHNLWQGSGSQLGSEGKEKRIKENKVRQGPKHTTGDKRNTV